MDALLWLEIKTAPGEKGDDDDDAGPDDAMKKGNKEEDYGEKTWPSFRQQMQIGKLGTRISDENKGFIFIQELCGEMQDRGSKADERSACPC